MAKREEHHVLRAIGRLVDVLIVLTVVAAVAAWYFDLGTRFNTAVGPSQVEAVTQELNLPRLEPPSPVAAPLADGTPSGEKIRQAIGKQLADPRMGPRRDAVVTNLTTGEVLYRHRDDALVPASTMKLLTGAAALEALGTDTRFSTEVRREPGTDRIVLVGGGDPYLTKNAGSAVSAYPRRARLSDLADRTADALKQSGTTTVRLGFDDSLFSGPAVSPDWPASYIDEGVAPPITALWVDQGHDPDGFGYVKDPSQQAGNLFAQALRNRGITVTGPVNRVRATASATSLGEVIGPSVGEIVSRLELVSDNNAAEVMAHQVGLKVTGEGSFAGGAKAVEQVLRGLGIEMPQAQIRDGSGLSRKNRLNARTQAQVLTLAASPEHPELREVITGMPVAGFSGSLTNRFDQGSRFGLGLVRAKTGTLTGVHGLAGVVTDADGNELGFVLLADQVPEDDQEYTRVKIDKIAAALAACHCGA